MQKRTSGPSRSLSDQPAASETTQTNVAGACQQQESKEPEQQENVSNVPPDEVLAAAPAITGALLAFAIDVHQKLREVGGSKNVLFSPFLAAGALISLYCGARGRAARHIARLLHLDSDPTMAVAYFALWHQRLFACWPNHHRHGFSATHDLALIRDRGVSLLPPYVACLAPWCRTEPDFFETDMGSSAIRMDLWIRALTSFAFREYAVFSFPRITGIEPVLLVSIAVLFVKGRWRERFELGFGTFHETPTKSRSVRIMRRRGRFRVADCGELDATAVEIPYQDPSKTMVVFLPRIERLSTFEHSLTPAELLRCLANLQEKEVDVTMPVLRLKKHTELIPIVSLLGSPDLFRSPGHLGGISDVKSLSVSTLTHVTVFHANSRGGKVALRSSSEAHISGSAPAQAADVQTFNVDHPFMFMVMNKDPDAVLVMGSVKKVSSRRCKTRPPL